MEPQPRLCIETFVSRHGIVAVDHAERFQHIPTLLRKVRRDTYKLAPSGGDAVSQQDLHSVSQLASLPMIQAVLAERKS
jgi:hypothetical protein